MGCATDVKVCIIRGTFWPLNVHLGREWVEVAETPSLYRCRLTFREFQDDDTPDLFSVIATPQIIPDALPTEPNVLISFGLAGTVTQTLPDYDVVGFCEIYLAAEPTNPTRLFNMKVSISD